MRAEGKLPELCAEFVTPASEDGLSFWGENGNVPFGELDDTVCVADGAQAHKCVLERRHDISRGGKVVGQLGDGEIGCCRGLFSLSIGNANCDARGCCIYVGFGGFWGNVYVGGS